MTLTDYVQHRISTINLPHLRCEYDILQPVATSCFGRDIYLHHRTTGGRIWIATFTATELMNGEILRESI